MKEQRKYGAPSLIARIYLLALCIMGSFRLILFFTELNQIHIDKTTIWSILQSFQMGIRFDLVIIGYIMSFPALVLIVIDILKVEVKILKSIAFYFLLLVLSGAFIICAADIPFFNEFYTRFSVTAFDWLGSPKFVFDMIRQEPKYFLVIIPLLLLIYLFYVQLKRLFKRFAPSQMSIPIKLIGSVFLLGLMFLGIRGRINLNSPIKVGTAYFCNHPFLNQLGLNPVFTLVRSTLDIRKEDNKKIHLMAPEKAFSIVRKSLNIENTKALNNLAHWHTADTNRAIRKANVIYIIMESMSAAKMARHGNQKKLTPFLDSLVHEGVYFDNHFSAGIHTYNGIFTTLFSFPALYRQRIMDNIILYNGINSELEKKGYTSTYFTTHDAQFDNMAGFLTANGFDQIISDANYPSHEIKTAMGVTDNFMFQYAMPILDSLHQLNKPFFTTFMTGSDHGPYFIPQYFKPKQQRIEDQAVEFADWSLRQFITRCSKKEWFKNTLFVFVADHGKPIKVRYSIPINFCHTPLLFFAPQIIDSNAIYSKPANQMDVFPTTMGILNLPYLKNNLGIDLLRENRPYAIFNYDDRIGVIDQEHLLVLRRSGEQELFKYKDSLVRNIIESEPKKVKDMMNYAYAHMQVYQELLKKNQLFKKGLK